ncbi:MAG TPA: hypothetical protein VF868_01600 [Bacteroidia bacterium]|jgi:hypothetical protein
MKNALFLIVICIHVVSCRKETAPAVHEIQFSSNIGNPQYYSIKINNSEHQDISETHSAGSGTDIELKLFAAGGDTTSIDSRDSLWVRGGIIVDRLLVSSFSGYRNAVLSYHIE